MSYANGHPIRLFGGRIALDFVNTADWGEDGEIVHEKLTDDADAKRWSDELKMDCSDNGTDMEELKRLRAKLREAFIDKSEQAAVGLTRALFSNFAKAQGPTQAPDVLDLIAISAVAILSDGRERDRIKMCPGENCGWLFIDETKNRRRTWCSMETCGNRAKAARHYSKKIQGR